MSVPTKKRILHGELLPAEESKPRSGWFVRRECPYCKGGVRQKVRYVAGKVTCVICKACGGTGTIWEEV